MRQKVIALKISIEFNEKVIKSGRCEQIFSTLPSDGSDS